MISRLKKISKPRVATGGKTEGEGAADSAKMSFRSNTINYEIMSTSAFGNTY